MFQSRSPIIFDQSRLSLVLLFGSLCGLERFTSFHQSAPPFIFLCGFFCVNVNNSYMFDSTLRHSKYYYFLTMFLKHQHRHSKSKTCS